ncbi:MAG: hypothetical protein GF317_03415 [Candidatus Lokiarchaeota archaeon]|nr:hypothetical protein [Candidatus Lokiarchaeota archaeon]MBD3198945.1 hypothetical protein [Candidatus Lokiarchaeota archaeon]
MILDFYNPPRALLALSSKEGLEIGGSKLIVSIDEERNFYSEGHIYSEMSWAEFYDEEGLEDVIDSFTQREFESINEDSEALVDSISETIHKIIKRKRLFYGVFDLEVDAFLNENTIIPGLKIPPNVINKLMSAHRNTRDKILFPKILRETGNQTKVQIKFYGDKKNHLIFIGSTLEELANQLRAVRGFATGIVCTTQILANFYILNDNIVYKDEDERKLYLDMKNIHLIEEGIKNEILTPVNWFRIDLGIHALETLDLWEKIKNSDKLQVAIAEYDHYLLEMIFEEFEKLQTENEIGYNIMDDFLQMNAQERKEILKDISIAIKILRENLKD